VFFFVAIIAQRYRLEVRNFVGLAPIPKRLMCRYNIYTAATGQALVIRYVLTVFFISVWLCFGDHSSIHNFLSIHLSEHATQSISGAQHFLHSMEP
jgi:hypothetical protein